MNWIETVGWTEVLLCVALPSALWPGLIRQVARLLIAWAAGVEAAAAAFTAAFARSFREVTCEPR